MQSISITVAWKIESKSTNVIINPLINKALQQPAFYS